MIDAHITEGCSDEGNTIRIVYALLGWIGTTAGALWGAVLFGGYPMGVHNVTEVKRFSMFLPAPILSTILLIIILMPSTQNLIENWQEA